MRKSTIALVFGIIGLVAGALLSNHVSAAGTSYGEELQVPRRYTFD